MSLANVSLERWSRTIRASAQAYSQKVTTSLEISRPKNHLLVLDGIRAVACLEVIFFHVNFLSRNYNLWHPMGGIKDLLAALLYFGESGVILFFLLSGFLLFLPFAKAILFEETWPSLSRFYLRRIFRIIPGYYVALLLIILFFHSNFLHAAYRGDLLHFLTFRMTFALSQQVNGPFWTLAVEFQFYMLLPLLAWLFALISRRGSLRWRLTKLALCLSLMLGWGLLTRYWGLFIADTSKLDFLIPHSISAELKTYIFGDTGKYFESFAIGMFLATLYTYTQYAPQGRFWQKKIQRWSPFLLLLGLAILGFLSVIHLYIISWNTDVTYKLYPVLAFLDPYAKLVQKLWLQWQSAGYSLCYGLCIAGLLYGSSRLRRVFEWPVLRWIGLISFSLYMWHLPLIWLYINFIRLQFVGWHPIVQYYALWAWVLFFIFPISLTMYRWIEMPGMRLGEMLIRRIEKLKKQPPNRQSLPDRSGQDIIEASSSQISASQVGASQIDPAEVGVTQVSAS